MPCHDAESAEEARNRKPFDPHNNPQAEMLCDVLERVNPSFIETLPRDTQDWWKAHEARDQRKKRKQMLEKRVRELRADLDGKLAELKELS